MTTQLISFLSFGQNPRDQTPHLLTPMVARKEISLERRVAHICLDPVFVYNLV